MPNTYTELRRTVVGTATSSVTLDLTGVSGYTDLVLVINGTTVGDGSFRFQFNGDTAANYSGTLFYGNGTNAISVRGSNETSGAGGRSGTTNSTSILHFMNYSNTTTYKTVIARGNNASAIITAQVALWRSTAAITSILLTNESGNIQVGSTFSLYGIANADQGAAKATGGMITEDATYWYHTFGASSAFIPKQSLTCDVLVVAGGGGGGNSYGAGGGGGGLLAFTSQALTAISYNVTVGAGGAGSAGAGSGTTGVDSQFGALTLVKGGGGGGFGSGPTIAAGGNGGSGGGGGATSTLSSAGGSPTSGQGNSGGAGVAGASGGGGGAGGAGGAGGGTGSKIGGAGGAGSSTYSSWGSVTGTGKNVSGTYYFAGGGSGNGESGTAVANVGGNNQGVSGDANTGTGAGGDVANSRGGSGVVIVRYAK